MAEIDWIADYFAPWATGKGAAGLSDDVARLTEGATIVTQDGLIEGVHFLNVDPIDTIARKLVRVNVSDLLAKGARPVDALLTLCWPETRPEEELARFAEALGRELHDWSAVLLGGDTMTHTGGLILSLTLTGRPVRPDGQIIRRSGAIAGDWIYVTGVIGRGGIGLSDAKAGRQSLAADHYRVPDVPSGEIANWIGAHAHAAMDVSDGLVADLAKLLDASGVGGALDLNRVPLASPTTDPSQILIQCTAGDDYQCLISAPAGLSGPAGIALHPLGRVETATGLRLFHEGRAYPLPRHAGFEHR